LKSPARVQALVAVGLGLALAGTWAAFGTPWRVKWIVSRGAPPAHPARAEAAEREIAALGPPARPVLEGILEDGSSARVRKTWVAAILLREPFFARAAVERALGSAHAPTARAAAAALLGGDGGETAPRLGEVAAPRATPHEWDPAPAVPVLLAWMADRADPESAVAARLLGRIPPGDPRVRDALLAAVEEAPAIADPAAAAAAKARKPVVVSAIHSLGSWVGSDPEVAPRVSKVVARLAKMEGAEAEWDLQAHALDLLEATRGRGVDEGLMELLAKSPNAVVRQKVSGALVAFPGSAPGRILAGLAGDDWPVVRRSAVRALGSRKDPLLLELAPYLVEDSLVWVRAETLLALGHLTGVDPEGCRAAVPLLVSCFETPWPGMVPEPGSAAAASWDNSLAEIVENCAVSLNRITGRSHGFRPEDLLDWKKRGEVALRLVKDPEARARAVAEWRTSVPPRPEEARVAPLVKRLEDRDPDNVLRAMRELTRITGTSEGFPAGILERAGDDTPNRNAIREWRKTPAHAECLRRWQERATSPR
jgi:hypothetical protein